MTANERRVAGSEMYFRGDGWLEIRDTSDAWLATDTPVTVER